MNKLIGSALLALLLTSPAIGRADVEVGQQAPNFALPDQSGKIHQLTDYRGKTVILAFYPKDFTGG
jgi:cytochrome oxidase Cu insertion factor (SCO1/SenC/PrrC family)